MQAWEPAAKAARERDHYTCQDCGSQGKPGTRKNNIHVHHLVCTRDGGTHDLNNLVTLCQPCHTWRHRKYGSIGRPPYKDSMTGEELKTIRQQLGLSQADLARILKISPAAICRWEKGNRSISGMADSHIRKYLMPSIDNVT